MIPSEESSTDYNPVTRKYCVLHENCNHITDNCNDLKALINRYNNNNKRIQSCVQVKRE